MLYQINTGEVVDLNEIIFVSNVNYRKNVFSNVKKDSKTIEDSFNIEFDIKFKGNSRNKILRTASESNFNELLNLMKDTKNDLIKMLKIEDLLIFSK